MIFTPQALKQLPLQSLPQAFMQMLQQPKTVSHDVLKHIIESSKDTEYGKRYNFAGIKSYEDFCRLPLTDWHDYAEYSERIADGCEDILFPGKAEYFIRTTGTTGENKYIPESHDGALAKSVITTLRQLILIDIYLKRKGLPFSKESISGLGHVLTLPQSGASKATKGGIPVDFASGLTNQNVDELFTSLFCFPLEILKLSEQSQINYLIVRFALSYDDVLGVVGNNASRLIELVAFAKANAAALISDIRNGTLPSYISFTPEVTSRYSRALSPNPERADVLQKLLDEDKFIPKYYWPKLDIASFWLGSTVGAYAVRARELMPDNAAFIDVGYGASEVKVNVPMQVGDPFGALCLFSAFYEFLPEDGGAPVTLEQVVDGGLYELVVTTYSGLYRYKMGDLIKVQGKTFDTPNVAFVSKTGDIANLTSEKLSGETILRAAHMAADKLGITLNGFQVYPCEADRSYHLYAELIGNDAAKDFAVTFDETLKGIADSYFRRRRENALHQPVCHIMQAGFEDSLYAAKVKQGMSRAQIKLPVVINIDLQSM